MDKWEYKVLRGLSEEELNKWGEVGYEIDSIISPLPPESHYLPEYRDRLMTIILKRRKP